SRFGCHVGGNPKGSILAFAFLWLLSFGEAKKVTSRRATPGISPRSRKPAKSLIESNWVD
ncbi:MAG: hypothetical protein ACHP7O_08965, partial [Burkholderiales bacterium]